MAILEFILDLLKQLLQFIVGVLSWLYDHFMEFSLFEKGVVLAVIPAFLAVILSVARFPLFGTYFYVNNPLAVYMIGIVIIMGITHFFPGIVSLSVRILVNLYYLFWVFYIELAGQIAQTQYTLTAGYYVNLVVPLIFVALSILSFFEQR
jgi:hypothetical protein